MSDFISIRSSTTTIPGPAADIASTPPVPIASPSTIRGGGPRQRGGGGRGGRRRVAWAIAGLLTLGAAALIVATSESDADPAPGDAPADLPTPAAVDSAGSDVSDAAARAEAALAAAEARQAVDVELPTVDQVLAAIGAAEVSEAGVVSAIERAVDPTPAYIPAPEPAIEHGISTAPQYAPMQEAIDAVLATDAD